MDQNVFKTFARVKCILCWAILIVSSGPKVLLRSCASKSDNSQELTWPSCCSWAYLQHILCYCTEKRNLCDFSSRWHNSCIQREWICNSLKLSSNLWLCQDRKSLWVFVCVCVCVWGDRDCLGGIVHEQYVSKWCFEDWYARTVSDIEGLVHTSKLSSYE
jgi:hypothetical protein